MRLRYLVNPLLAVVVVLASGVANVSRADTFAAPLVQAAPTRVPIVVALQPGDRLTVTCEGGVLSSAIVAGTPIALCDALTATAVPSATATLIPATLTATATLAATSTRTLTPTRTPSLTRTPRPPTATRTPSPTRTATTAPATATATPTATASAVPSATHDHGGATATAAPATAVPSGIYDSAPIAAVILGTCSAAVHDRYTATGPDGRTYRTWHPQTVENGAGGTCVFAHEHGVDPATSVIPNPEPITFDYISRISEQDGMPMPEAHEGFKVHVVNVGDVNDEGRVAQVSALMMYHMGTGGTRRYTQSMHTLAAQAIMPGGAYVSVRGMADTHDVGSICARDRRQVVVGRSVMTLPDVAEPLNAGQACEVGAPYEIWEFVLSISRNIAGEDPLMVFNASLAAFDPITTLDVRDPSRVIYTGDAFPPSTGAPFLGYDHWRGCDREFYVGGVTLRNRGSANAWTNSHGQVLSGVQTAATALRQIFPVGYVFESSSPAYAWNVLGLEPSGAPGGNQFKLRQPTCAPGLGTRN